MHVKKNDNVIILSGDDKGKKGKILEVFPRIGMVVIEGVNLVKKHERPRKQGQKGQVVERPMPIHASKVARVGETTKKKPAKK